MATLGTNRDATIGRYVLEFCVLEFVLSLPFWTLIALAHAGLIPNYQMLNSLWSLTPAAAVWILVSRKDGWAGIKTIMRRCVDWGRIEHKVRYVPIFLVVPFIIFTMYGVAVLKGQNPPAPRFSWLVPGVYVVFLLLVWGEELAWTPYLTDGLQERFGALIGAILVGVLHGLFHGPVWVAAGWPAKWVAWQFVYVVALRVVFVWVYNNAGRSMFAVELMHPGIGAYFYFWPVSQDVGIPAFYDPRTLALAAIAIAVAVTVVWGPKTLAHFPGARRRP